MIALEQVSISNNLPTEPGRGLQSSTHTAGRSTSSGYVLASKEHTMAQQEASRSKGQQSLTHILTPEQEQDSLPRSDERRQDYTSPSQTLVLPPIVPRSPPRTSRTDGDLLHKRKRSISQDVLSTSGNTYHNKSTVGSHSSPTPPSDNHGPRKEVTMTMSNQANTSGITHSEQKEIAHGYAGSEPITKEALQWTAPHLPDQQTPPTLQSSVSEEQFREALVRETRGSSDSQGNNHLQGYATSPNEGSYHDGFSDQNLTQLQQDENKKRKRNFSNRTKTGCMTCRRRKKKCDEQRPECQNCVRGGFDCCGYPTARMWPTPSVEENKTLPPPLQAKDVMDGGVNLPQSYGSSQTVYQLPPVQDRRDPLVPYSRLPPTRIDTPQLPSHMLLDERLSATSLNTGSSYDSRMTSATPFPLSSAYLAPMSAHSAFQGLSEFKAPPYDHPERRNDATTSHIHPHSLAPINILNSPQPSSSPLLLPRTSAQDAARLALSYPTTRPASQKDAMVAGQRFYSQDRELVQERERCSSACWQFNNSNGVSLEERARLFRKILLAGESNNISPTERRSPIHGRVGQEVIVDGPFVCDYGFNISIGDSVAIGKNCTIMDACEVSIGSKTVLGPNVNIYTEFLDTDSQQRAGSTGPRYAAKVVIEEDCFIGGGATILPGRTIGRGATIGAGSVVSRASADCYDSDVPMLMKTTGCATAYSRCRKSGEDYQNNHSLRGTRRWN